LEIHQVDTINIEGNSWLFACYDVDEEFVVAVLAEAEESNSFVFAQASQVLSKFLDSIRNEIQSQN
jgi:hypothetical protein